MFLYSIPPLYCPFPSYTNTALVKKIEAHTNRWLRKFKLLESRQAFVHYKSQCFASMIVRSYPFGETAALCAWCDLNTLLFIIDDQLDEQFIIRDKTSLTNYSRNILAILEDRDTITEVTGIPAALQDFWQNIKPISSLHWRQTFIQNIKDMFAGGMWQLQHIIQQEKPSFRDYFLLRQYLGAAHLATDSLELTGNIRLEPQVYQHPTIQHLTRCARNAICFANDLFSLGKEMAQSQGGALFNIVTILKNEHAISMEEAIAAAAQLHDQQVTDFIKTTETAMVFDPEVNEMVRKYIAALGYLMRGNIDWSTSETTRYPHIHIEKNGDIPD